MVKEDYTKDSKGRFVKGHTSSRKGTGSPLYTIKLRKFYGGMREMIKIKCGTNHNEMLYSRYLIEKKLGRKLKSDEIVHHKDGNRLNDNIKNLMLVTRKKHSQIHHKKDKSIMKAIKKSNETYRQKRLNFKQRIIELHKQNKSQRRMARILGISTYLVRRILEEVENGKL